MGPEIAIPLIASAVGTGMQYMAQRDAEKARKRQIDDMMAYNQAQSNRIISDVEAEAPRYTQQNIQAETQGVQQEGEARLLNDLKTALEPTTREVAGGKVSSEYLAKKAERASEEATRGANLARLFAAIDAPNQTRLKQSLDAADARARRQAIASGTNVTLQNMGNDLSSIQPNPLLTTAGGLAIGGAQAYSNATANDRIKKALEGQRAPTIFAPGV